MDGIRHEWSPISINDVELSNSLMCTRQRDTMMLTTKSNQIKSNLIDM